MLLIAGLSAAMIFNGAWLIHAAQTILDASPASLVRASDSYIRNRPHQTFVLSRPMEKQFQKIGEPLPGNARNDGPGDHFVILDSQIRDGKVTLRDWPASSAETFRVVGPLEVDFDYYPTWEGDDRVLFLTQEDADRFGLTRDELSLSP